MRIVDILAREVHHTAHDIARILTSCEHPTDPVDGSIAVAITQGLVHRRDEVIVFIPVLIVHERLGSCLEDRLASECSRALKDTRRLEEIECIPHISTRELRDECEGISMGFSLIRRIIVRGWYGSPLSKGVRGILLLFPYYSIYSLTYSLI